MRVKVRKGYQFFRSNGISVGDGSIIADATPEEVNSQKWKVEVLKDSQKQESSDKPEDSVEEVTLEEDSKDDEKEDSSEEVEVGEEEEEEEDPDTENEAVASPKKDRAVKSSKRKKRG